MRACLLNDRPPSRGLCGPTLSRERNPPSSEHPAVLHSTFLHRLVVVAYRAIGNGNWSADADSQQDLWARLPIQRSCWPFCQHGQGCRALSQEASRCGGAQGEEACGCRCRRRVTHDGCFGGPQPPLSDIYLPLRHMYIDAEAIIILTNCQSASRPLPRSPCSC